MEDYLETILILSKQKAQVRSIDVANELGYSKPSVSVAMKNLRQKNYVLVSEGGYLSLTEEGLNLASTVYERHSVISNWLISLGVSQEVAVEDACRMEHDISDESFAAIKKYLQDAGEIILYRKRKIKPLRRWRYLRSGFFVCVNRTLCK